MLIRRDDDELISAYVDGQLKGRERQAFEARMSADPALRRQVEATRRLVQAARALPPLSAPRNFTLPKTMAAPARSAPARGPGASAWWRLGSAVAAAVFVFALALDISGVATPRPQAAAPQVAQEPLATELVEQPAQRQATSAEAANAESQAEEAERSVAPTAEAGDAAGAAEAPPQPAATAAPAGTTAPPEAPSPKVQAASEVTSTEKTSAEITMLAVPEGTTTPPGIQAPELVTETAPLSQAYGVETPAADGEPSLEMQAVATPASDVTSMADAAPTMTVPSPEAPPQAAPAPQIHWLRVLAVASLLIALGLGALGWLRR